MTNATLKLQGILTLFSCYGRPKALFDVPVFIIHEKDREIKKLKALEARAPEFAIRTKSAVVVSASALFGPSALKKKCLLKGCAPRFRMFPMAL